LELRQAVAETRAIWTRANAYLQETAPWSAIKSDPARAAVTTRTGLNLARLSAVVAWSIVPTLAERVHSALGDHSAIPSLVPPWPTQPAADLLRDASAGQPIEPIGPLVAKLDDADIARLSRRFGGDEERT
jgi:methionyl-tRNA synthetase